MRKKKKSPATSECVSKLSIEDSIVESFENSSLNAEISDEICQEKASNREKNASNIARDVSSTQFDSKLTGKLPKEETNQDIKKVDAKTFEEEIREEFEKATNALKNASNHQVPIISERRSERLEVCRICEKSFTISSFKEHADMCAKNETNLPGIQDFLILSTIAEGSYGQVYVCRKKTTEDVYAIKRIKKDSLKTNMNHISNEAKILKYVQHPFIVNSYWSFQSKECIYFAMEYASGGDIYSLLERFGNFDQSVAKFYIAETIDALAYLHSEGIVHRDIKPDNLLISSQGHIKITDFGLSSTAHSVSLSFDLRNSATNPSNSPSVVKKFKKRIEQTEKKLFSGVGTPDYVSPEVLAGIGYGFCVDWWAIGAVLFEMLTGVPPFNGESARHTIYNIKQHNIVNWTEQLPDEAKDLITKLLQRIPENRLGYQGADEIKSHPFFKDVTWDQLTNQQPPFVPTLSVPESTIYFKGSFPFCGEQPRPTTDNLASVDEDTKYNDFSFVNMKSLQVLNEFVLQQF